MSKDSDFATAHNVRRHNSKKMTKGVVDNEKLHPSHEPAMSHAASIAKAILSSSKGYADGGLVQEDDHGFLDNQSGQGDEMEALSESGDDFLAYEPEEELDGVTNTNKRLSSIFNGIRMSKLKK